MLALLRKRSLLQPSLSRQNFSRFASSINPNTASSSSSSSSSSSKKKTMGDRTADGKMPAMRNTPRRRISDPVNKLSSFHEDGPSTPTYNAHRDRSTHTVWSKQRQNSHERVTSKGREHAEGMLPDPIFFDICRTQGDGVVRLQKSLLEINREKRMENRRKLDDSVIFLRPGMILLKRFISYDEQVNVIKICQKLGIGEGGFYRPGYRDGAKLHLQMMCLGKNWDPESRLYEDRRSFDGAMTPKIPEEFKKLVDRALQESHDFLQKSTSLVDAEELPWMFPDICIVNFYSNSGKLGLHQDRDESTESLQKGLPVVSFSVGDSANFSFGDERDVEKARKVLLESGDVLIFGGKSRHVYHGVDSIEPNTAPKYLVEETKLKPGRLNLTFRQC